MSLYGRQIQVIAIDPDNSSTLYAGSWGGDGLFKSTNSGETWETIPLYRNSQVNDISIDPNNSSNIWIAINNFVDVSYDRFKSRDIFYFDFALDEFRSCYTVEVDPHDLSGNTV